MKIAFYKGHGNWMDFLIRLKTKGIYSHIELLFSDGLSFSSSQRDRGTRFKKIHYDRFHWDLLELKISQKQEARIRAFCERENKKSYDLKAVILTRIFNFHNQNNSNFCSEICTKALQRVKLLATVTDFMLSPQSMYSMLLEEECVVNRAELKLQFEKKNARHRESFLQVLYTSFAVWILLFIVSFLIDRPSLHSFLGSLF